ncbi:MAG: cache domain-containing protein [Candidatus Omnitrophota bacterium]|nr:cache domain-containing protein [Candidatus Omnitrophota bacterium]
MKRIASIIGMVVIIGLSGVVLTCAAQELPDYKYRETKDLVSLVRDAAGIITTKGEAAFTGFKKEGSPWRHGEVYIFVLDTAGNMVVHPDPALEGKDQIGLKDVNGKFVIKGIIEATASDSNRNEGWYHYQWPEPGTIFSDWKSAFAKRVVAPSGKAYVACSGLYNPKMEEAFLINAVDAAVALIEKEGTTAFSALRDKSTQFVFLGTYIFVDTPEGVEVVNGGFPDIEGKNILDYKDPDGKYLTREIIDTATKKGSGWVDYLWPKPGEIKSSRKHTYVRKAVYGGSTFAVGSGAYIKDELAAALGDAGDISGQFMVLELKGGDLTAGRIIRETRDSVFLMNSDGSMEVSFPRSRIARIRKPTDMELEKINKGQAAKPK